MNLFIASRHSRLLARAVAVVSVIALVLFAYPSPLAKGPEIHFHHELFDTGPEKTTATPLGGLSLYHSESNQTLVYLAVDVAVDEEFVEYAGDNLESELKQTLNGANALLGEIGVTLRIDSIRWWHSDNSIPYISSQLNSAERQIQKEPGNVLLAITGQNTSRYDGYARESSGDVIVQFYPKDRQYTYSIIAHEIGHLLGADEHENEADCTEDGCIMDEEGFAHATTWCEHHRNILQENIVSALAVQSS